MNTAKIVLLYINNAMPNTNILIRVNITPRNWVVRKLRIRSWSARRCSISPLFRISKKDIGSRISLMKKLFSSDRFMRIERCSSSQPRTNSVAVRPTIIVSSPSSISHISLNDEFLMPASTMACVRNGINSCIRQATDSPKRIWIKYRRCFFIKSYITDKSAPLCRSDSGADE